MNNTAAQALGTATLSGEAIIAVKRMEGGSFPVGTKLPFVDCAPDGWEEVDRVPWSRLASSYKNHPASKDGS